MNGGFRGDRLRELRLKKGLTQEELGKLMRLTKSAICFYETGKRQPSHENIIDFMQIFAVSADYLIGAENLIKTFTSENHTVEYLVMTNEEVSLIEELRKDKTVYDIIFQDPKRGAEIIKNRIG